MAECASFPPRRSSTPSRADAQRVGLVGAAVSDHPSIVRIVNTLADRGCEVGLSSLRPDKLARGEDFVAALARVGYRTLTTAMDGTSERVRESLDRRARPQHLLRCAELAKKHGMDRLEALPDDRNAGRDGRRHRRVRTLRDRDLEDRPARARNRPVLREAQHAARRIALRGHQASVDARLDRLRRGLKGRVDVRATSARWAWVEYVLAQGGEAEGAAVVAAVENGGSFRAYERAFAAIEPRPARRALKVASA